MSRNYIETKMNTARNDDRTVEHSNTVAYCIEKKPVLSEGEYVAEYTSPRGEKMWFFYFSNHEIPIWVQLEKNGTETLIPLWIKELNGNRHRDFLLSVIDGCLHDTNLRPEYCRIDKQVRFFWIHPEEKNWILQFDRCLRLPNASNTLFVYQSNGCISYVNNQNRIHIWDSKNGRSREKDLIVDSKITALVEQNNDLIVGCEDGGIFMPNYGRICPKKSSVVEMVAIGPLYFAARYQDNSANLINADGTTTGCLNEVSGIWSIRDRFFFALQQKNILIFVDIHKIENFHENNFSSELTKDDVIVVSDTVFIVAKDEVLIRGGGTSWSTLKKKDFCSIWLEHRGHICEKNCSECLNHESDINEKIRHADLSWRDLLGSIKRKTFVYSSPGTFIFPQTIPTSRLVCLSYFSSVKAEPPVMFHVNGRWNITSMILLRDGSIMYATDRSPSGIHVITKAGEQLFSKYEELTSNKEITSLKEMMDGSVATTSDQNYIRIIRPRIIPSRNMINEIHALRSKLMNNPSNLDLYDEWSKKFLYPEYSAVPHYYSAYQTQLDGLEAAAQAGNLYQARKFYEKAKNIFPDRDEPMRLFLTYLMKFPDIKIERTIHLDLFKLLENKKCKQRLFIGEGDFTYTESLIAKHIDTHKQLSNAIVATELLESDQMNDGVKERIRLLEESGVRIFTGVDGEKMHKHPVLKNMKFERVHWNCPFGGDSSLNGRESFRKVIPNFFRSCEKLQLTGDRVHVTLVQGWKGEEWHEFRQYENPIVKGSVEAGYRLIRKRPFGKERYPNYKHRSSDGQKLTVPGVHREFVFEKVSKSDYNLDMIKEKIKKTLPIENAQKKYFIKANNKKHKYDNSSKIELDDYYFECSTDYDSSDYYSD